MKPPTLSLLAAAMMISFSCCHGLTHGEPTYRRYDERRTNKLARVYDGLKLQQLIMVGCPKLL